MDGLVQVGRRRRHVGDVRGKGLAIGVEIVVDKVSKKPWKRLAEELMYKMKERKVLVGVVGIFGNVVTVTPPLCFTLDNAKTIIETLDKLLEEIEEQEKDEEERWRNERGGEEEAGGEMGEEEGQRSDSGNRRRKRKFEGGREEEEAVEGSSTTFSSSMAKRPACCGPWSSRMEDVEVEDLALYHHHQDFLSAAEASDDGDDDEDEEGEGANETSLTRLGGEEDDEGGPDEDGELGGTYEDMD